MIFQDDLQSLSWLDKSPDIFGLRPGRDRAGTAAGPVECGYPRSFPAWDGLSTRVLELGGSIRAALKILLAAQPPLLLPVHQLVHVLFQDDFTFEENG